MDQQVINAFNQLLITHKTMHRRYLNDLGLFLGQPRLLYFIKKNPGCSQKDLVEHLEVSKEAVSNSVRRLENKGLVKRKSDKDDKRKVVLNLTPPGLELLDRVWAKQNETYALLLEPLSDLEKKELARLFETIVHHAREKGAV